MHFLRSLIEEIKPEEVKLNVKYHNELNPALWDKMVLKPEVSEKLKVIASTFVEFLGIPELDVIDIHFTGSNANYNWTTGSDIDLHVLADLTSLRKSCGDMVDEFFAAKKKIWNDLHNITIYGFNTEMYVQDTTEKHTSSGIYSLKNDKWVVKPQRREPTVDDVAVKKKAAHIMNEIDDVVSGAASNVDKIEQLKTKIKNLRQSGLEREGEFSVENLAFKTLRNNGYLEKLFDSYTNAIDRELSLR